MLVISPDSPHSSLPSPPCPSLPCPALPCPAVRCRVLLPFANVVVCSVFFCFLNQERVVPEYSFLEPRGMGIFDGEEVATVLPTVSGLCVQNMHADSGSVVLHLVPTVHGRTRVP